MSGDDAGPGEVSHARGVGGPGGAGGAGWNPRRTRSARQTRTTGATRQPGTLARAGGVVAHEHA